MVKFFAEKVFVAAQPVDEPGGLGKDVTLRAAIEASLPSLEIDFDKKPLLEARLRSTVGKTLSNLGENQQALKQLSRAGELYAIGLGADDLQSIQAQKSVSWVYMLLGRYDESFRLRTEILAKRRRLLPADHPDTIVSIQDLAVSLYYLKRYEESYKLLEEAYAANLRAVPRNYQRQLMCMDGMANALGGMKRIEDALKVREEMMAIARRELPANHRDHGHYRYNLAITYKNLGRYQEALTILEADLAKSRINLPPNHPDLLRRAFSVASILVSQKRYGEALTLHEEALAGRRRIVPSDHPELLESVKFVAICLINLKRGSEALPLIEEILAEANRPGVDPRLIPFAIELRLSHYQKAGDISGCRATADMLEKLKRGDSLGLYAAARCRAVTASLQAKSKEPDAARLAGEDADIAMTWLTSAVAAGWTDVDHIKKNSDLDPLREREDFKKLLAELEAKAEKK